MAKKGKTIHIAYNQNHIEVADYIFLNPTATRKQVIAKFAKKWQMPIRTFDRILKKSKEYNFHRRENEERQKVKTEELSKQVKKEVENDILSRNKILSDLKNDFIALGRIQSGAVFKDVDSKTGDIVGYRQANFSDENNAKKTRMAIAQQLSNMEGWNAPSKSEVTNINPPVIQINVIDSGIPLVDSEDKIED